ncbi:hypothetical protein GOAMI_08_00480 [Gordonia amicalis NBRC 100051 = JCM 11271]|nr:hypothetical protein GOAMI_08_00480 [Gordonia amicalis NBRC 100051 = JCM 11271]
MHPAGEGDAQGGVGVTHQIGLVRDPVEVGADGDAHADVEESAAISVADGVRTEFAPCRVDERVMAAIGGRESYQPLQIRPAFEPRTWTDRHQDLGDERFGDGHDGAVPVGDDGTVVRVDLDGDHRCAATQHCIIYCRPIPPPRPERHVPRQDFNRRPARPVQDNPDPKPVQYIGYEPRTQRKWRHGNRRCSA